MSTGGDLQEGKFSWGIFLCSRETWTRESTPSFGSVASPLEASCRGQGGPIDLVVVRTSLSHSATHRF